MGIGTSPPEKRPAMLALWHGLGEIYRTRLKDYPSAIAAFEVAVGLDPESDRAPHGSWPSCIA